jgi:hypothetical protein
VDVAEGEAVVGLGLRAGECTHGVRGKQERVTTWVAVKMSGEGSRCKYRGVRIAFR